MPIERILGVGGKTGAPAAQHGVMKVHTLQEVPIDLMQRLLGEHGPVLWRKANGIDDSPVIAWHERKSIGTERTFERDTIDVAKLRGLFTAMTETLAFQLRRGRKLTSCITVKVRYADFNTHTRQQRIGYTACDHLLLPVVHELFTRLYDRRQRVRLIGVRFNHLVGGGHRSMLTDTEEAMSLYQAMDSSAQALRRPHRDARQRHGRPQHRQDGRPFDGQAPPLLANRRT